MCRIYHVNFTSHPHTSKPGIVSSRHQVIYSLVCNPNKIDNKKCQCTWWAVGIVYLESWRALSPPWHATCHAGASKLSTDLQVALRHRVQQRKSLPAQVSREQVAQGELG